MSTKTMSAPRILVRLIWLAIAVLVVLQVLDVLSTTRFVKALGIENESNPLARNFFICYGTLGLWLHKLLILVFGIPVTWILHTVSRKYLADRENTLPLILFLSFFLGLCIYLDWHYVEIVVANFSVRI